MSDQLTPDALAGAVERVQRLRDNFHAQAEWARTHDVDDVQPALTAVESLDVLLSCAASHVPEADREKALERAAFSDYMHMDTSPAMAEARKLLRLPSQTEQGS